MNKLSHSSDTPLKMVHYSIDIFSDCFCANFNNLIKTTKFTKNFKLSDIKPLNKKGKKDIKGNYR